MPGILDPTHIEQLTLRQSPSSQAHTVYSYSERVDSGGTRHFTALTGLGRDSHDVLWVPVHHCILEIKSFEIGGCCCFYFFREAEVTTELGDFANIELDKQVLLLGVQERDF